VISFCVYSEKVKAWVTNWYEYDTPFDIDWDKVREYYPTERIGYMVGKGRSANLTSARNRVELSGPGRVYFAPVAERVYNVYRVTCDNEQCHVIRIANDNGPCRGEVPFTIPGGYDAYERATDTYQIRLYT